ncbi:uncharacterized protein LOC143059653 [Mytilus galloprovincialis]|uniref:uncharacterized protein LOC143059653 n=1 Tax=Mytilus galloprovincialis TaxID=29158 RepID=UPI003F7B521B
MFTLNFIYLHGFMICVFNSFSPVKTLDCIPLQLKETTPVSCTAVLYRGDACNETELESKYTDLYGKDIYPGCPDDLQLKPIMEIHPRYPDTGYRPGFVVTIKPPRTADFLAVKGFQLDYQDSIGNKRCIVLELVNTILTVKHKENDLKFQVKIYPLAQDNRDYIFNAYSLPTPKYTEEKEFQTRYGQTNKWELQFSYQWRTTIAFYVNQKDRFIDFRFVPAPAELQFYWYNITLSRIVSKEGTSLEDRHTVSSMGTNLTEMSFHDIEPGRYRVGVQPFDDKAKSFSECKCKNSFSVCVSCLKTLTRVIEIPVDNTPSAPIPSPALPLATKPKTSTTTSPLSLTTKHKNSAITTEVAIGEHTVSDKDAMAASVVVTSQQDNQTTNQLTVAFSIVGFLVLVLVAGICYKIYGQRSNESKLMDVCKYFYKRPSPNDGNGYESPTVAEKVPHTSVKQKGDVLNNERWMVKKKVAVIAADDNEFHTKVVESLATYLQSQDHCKVNYFPWNKTDDKLQWITTTADDVDFHVIVLSASACSQYDAFTNNRPIDTTDIFIPYLSKVLNQVLNHQKIIFVKFDYSSDLSMPNGLGSSFQLLDNFTGFLSHIHKHKPYEDQMKTLPFSKHLSETREGRDLMNAVDNVIKISRFQQSKMYGSRMDSGYKSHCEMNSVDEKEWRDSTQTNVINAIVQEQPVGVQYGQFVIDPDICSFKPVDDGDGLSLFTTITIAEGEAGDRIETSEEAELHFYRGQSCVHAGDAIPRRTAALGRLGDTSKHTRHISYANDKNGQQIKPNLNPTRQENELCRKQSESKNGSKDIENEAGAFIISGDNYVYPGTDFFLPPDPSINEDITTEYQFNMMDDINRGQLHYDLDNVSGKSV